MHRTILGAPQGHMVDHINRDGLDNRRINLRAATRAQNACNAIKRHSIRSTSQFKGVHWDKARSRWAAQIKKLGKVTNIGRFISEEDAARAYDTAAKKVYGEFARLNFPE
jgi:hypothetical protein